MTSKFIIKNHCHHRLSSDSAVDFIVSSSIRSRSSGRQFSYLLLGSTQRPLATLPSKEHPFAPSVVNFLFACLSDFISYFPPVRKCCRRSRLLKRCRLGKCCAHRILWRAEGLLQSQVPFLPGLEYQRILFHRCRWSLGWFQLIIKAPLAWCGLQSHRGWNCNRRVLAVRALIVSVPRWKNRQSPMAPRLPWVHLLPFRYSLNTWLQYSSSMHSPTSAWSLASSYPVSWHLYFSASSSPAIPS